MDSKSYDDHRTVPQRVDRWRLLRGIDAGNFPVDYQFAIADELAEIESKLDMSTRNFVMQLAMGVGLKDNNLVREDGLICDIDTAIALLMYCKESNLTLSLPKK